MKITLFPLLLISLFLSPIQGEEQEKQPLPPLDSSLQEELASYISEQFRSPTDYIIDKFGEHDIVFLGETHRVKNQVELAHHLIPLLYENGIYNLAYEFANCCDQSLIDSLINADEYDQALAYRVSFNHWPYMGYKEYIDVYKAAWELNRKLPANAKKFRIIGLNSRADFSLLKKSEDVNNPEIMRKVRPEGPRDSVMAVTIMREIVERGEKGLVYCGFGHAFTKYRWPRGGRIKCSVFTDKVGTAGNIIHEKIGDRCMSILIHSPWYALNDGEPLFVYAVDGILDTLMLTIDEQYREIGFDVVGTPFAQLPGKTAYWSLGDPEFSLGTICDGYIYLCPLSEYEGVSVAEGFITEKNRVKTIMQSGNVERRDTTTTVSEIIKGMERTADLERLFGSLK
jgi:hypothetical protein